MADRVTAQGRMSGPLRSTPPSSVGGETTEQQPPQVLDRIFLALEEIRAILTGLRKDLYTVEEVAELTGRSPYTVRRWVHEKKLRARRIEGTGPKGRLLIPSEELTRLLSQGLCAVTPTVVIGG